MHAERTPLPHHPTDADLHATGPAFVDNAPVALPAHGSYRQRFVVEYDYPVCFTERLFHPANPLLVDTLCRHEPHRRHRAVVWIDAGLLAAQPQLRREVERYFSHHAGRIALAAVEAIPGGEDCKNDPALVGRLQRRLVELGADRHSYVIAIGGGAVLDLAGFVAATTHRGVRHVRVPSTVLAQDDSGVGVKNGVNAFGMKNLLGTFAPPFAVLNDFALLDALPAREKTAGMAEAVKVALIRDRRFFLWIEQNARALADFDPDPLRRLIRRCAELHMHQIARGGDPFESGSARPLDFGHWAAHKLEALTHHAVRHGEAVAIGIALDARYSVLAGLLPAGEDARICRLLETLGFALWHPALRTSTDAGEPVLLQGLREFREHLGGELTITLLEAIGVGREVHAMDPARILAALDWLELRAAQPAGVS